MIFRNLKRSTKVILTVQIVGMLIGTYTHLTWILKNGFLSSNYNSPFISKIFWDCLTFLDPLAAALLFFKPKTGLYLTLLIIFCDVIHNNIFYIEELYLSSPIGLVKWIQKYYMIFLQIVFGLFVLITFQNSLKDVESKT